MSTIYNGVAGNVSPPGALTITNVSAGATPTVTVSSPLPASIVSTFTVDISGVQGATGVNGTNTATKTGASTFTVPVGAPGTYTTGGSAQPILLEAITIPADGDLGSAASVNTPFESLQDQVAFLLNASCGPFKQVQRFNQINQGAITVNSSVAGSPTATTGGVWADWTGTLASFMPFSGAFAQPINVENGDQVEVTFSSNFRSLNAASANACMISVWYANWVPGGTETFTQAFGSGAQITVPNPGLTIGVPFLLRSTILMSTTGLFDFKVRLVTFASTTTSDFSLIGGWNAEAIVWRPTISVPV